MIQKITPKKFVSDKDERLVAANEMILAENVTISERTDGSASILKTMKGTTEIAKDSGEDTPASTWKVVGSVSDDQRSRVYLFVHDTADATNDRIVMSEGGGAWVTVFKSSYLAFSEDYPVKADVINKAFQQDGNLQSVLYFTDNNNPPRKINVDRAIAGGYFSDTDNDGNPIESGSEDYDFALLTMRAAPNNAPTFSFDTDTDITTNNFQNDTFQFACQFIYKDGEESALSAYSNLAVSPYLVGKGVTSISNASSLSGNVCLVDLPWNVGQDSDVYVDVSKIRLLARSENSDPFFIIDEFDPREDLDREMGDSTEKEVYNAGTGIYRFYNDGYYANVSGVVSGKLYDNVPLKAEGQTLAASRLLYSNYTEGYPNYDIAPSVELSVSYGSASDFGGDFLYDVDGLINYPLGDAYVDAPAKTAAEIRGEINIDFRDGDGTQYGLNWPGSSPASLSAVTLPEGTELNFSFRFNGIGSYQPFPTSPTAPDYLMQMVWSHPNGDVTIALGYDDGTNDSTVEIPTPFNLPIVTAKYRTGAGETAQDVYDNIKAYFQNSNPIINVYYAAQDIEWVCTDDGGNPGISVGDTVTENISSGSYGPRGYIASFALGDVEDGTTDGILKIRPYIKSLKWDPGTQNISAFTGLPSGTTAAYTSYGQFTESLQQNIINGTTLGYISATEATANAVNSQFSFKHGSSHDFGIVYYDKWGRSSFVNKIGSAYVKHPAERASGDNKGGATVNVTIDNTQDSTIPSWADKYQVVYGGSQYSNVFSYTTGGAYIVNESGTTVTTDHRIFVSLNNLDQYQNQSGSPRDYSFTKGDICRVISYSNAGTTTYPSSNEGGIIEFEVVGVETITSTDAYSGGEGNPIQATATAAAETNGEFLVLRAPRVDGGLEVDTDGNGTLDSELKYEGFDWFSIAAQNYPNGDSATGGNLWGQETVIEILTPKKVSDTPIYYEIGERIDLNLRDVPATGTEGLHGPVVKLTEGDVQFRLVSCRGPVYTSSWNKADLGDWEDKALAIENQTPGEFITEKAWSKGRTHATFERAATVNRYNSITFSEPYADDTAVLALSSFVPSQANFFDLPSEHGPCTFLGLSTDQLIAIQENKVSRLGLNKGVLETGTQSGVVTISSKLINNLVSYGGDFGTSNPESVLIRDGVVYFVDAERRSLIKLSNKGLEIISDKDIKSTFQYQVALWENASGKTIVSGFDPEDDIYYVTLSPQGGFDGYTLGYDEKGGFWQGNYTFYADRYASLKDRFFGLKRSAGTLIHEFKDISFSNRYFDSSGSSDASTIRVVSNANPSMVKTFQALSVESRAEWSAKLIDSDGRDSKAVTFSEREGSFYGMVEGIANYTPGESRQTNDVRYLPLGTVDTCAITGGSTETTITLTNNLRGMTIPINYSLYYIDGSGDMVLVTAEDGDELTVKSVDRSASTVVFDGDMDLNPASIGNQIFSGGEKLFVAHALDGLTSESIRDHYAIVELSHTPASALTTEVITGQELYAINTHFVNSPLNDAIGGQ